MGEDCNQGKNDCGDMQELYSKHPLFPHIQVNVLICVLVFLNGSVYCNAVRSLDYFNFFFFLPSPCGPVLFFNKRVGLITLIFF